MSLIDRLSGVMDPVSMTSGLEGRNNGSTESTVYARDTGLNEVRPRRPEQCNECATTAEAADRVSMKSGLEGRNNVHLPAPLQK